MLKIHNEQLNENYEEFEQIDKEDLEYNHRRKKYILNGILSIIFINSMYYS